ncbi:MAG TPA: DUF3857 domain-containing protein [Chitinophagaceae bacterium]|nr:DUF3857 domain-containing protein [Chitinophagaceae bacterium]
MRRLLIISYLMFSLLPVMAGEGEYAVSRISPLLLKNANAILRTEQLRFEVFGTNKAVYRNHYAITILNENGDLWAECYEYYDKYKKIESAEGFLYDAAGNQLKKMKIKDMEDMSGVSSSSLMDDNRVKRHNFYHKVYPYTIEYDIVVEYKSTFFFPSWVPASRGNLSVESSSMSMVCHDGYRFRYKAFNYAGEPVVVADKNVTTTTWTVKNIPALVKEPYAPMWHELTTMVIFGPTDFQMDSYKGNMQSWQDFGKYQYALLQGRDQLPDHVKQRVHQLTDAITDKKEKIALLYDYLQKNTRYISIQLGIGGWQPFEAKFVAEKAYGDCKALTNFMASLLKEAGIKSYYTLIRAGENAGYITHDFPSQQFNHVILCAVPQPADTVWLECTSQTLPCGYLSDFTDDRYALLVDENGGRLVRTPCYGVNENTVKRTVKAALDEQATLSVQSLAVYGGTRQDEIHGLINNLSKEKVKEHLQEELDFATYDITRFQYDEKKTALPVIEELLYINVSNYATFSGRRLFILPNIMTRSLRKPAADEQRKYDLVLSNEFTEQDSVEIILPKGYRAESMPPEVKLKTPFGVYESYIKLEGDKLRYRRTLQVLKGRFAPAAYNEMVKFYETIFKADRSRVVLVKEETTKGF